MVAIMQELGREMCCITIQQIQNGLASPGVCGALITHINQIFIPIMQYLQDESSRPMGINSQLLGQDPQAS